ncbi:MAG TPA: MFS transporter [Acidimicrobiia bacterium]|nr:MFS transporter [Acidimicrobiia bacterium]
MAPTSSEPDPRRWLAAAVVIVSVFIPVLDNTVLNVAVPTIVRDFDTDLQSVQWVLTGYSLTFATLLVIGGRLGDLFGHRRMFIVGATIFGVGSLLAALSQNVVHLFIGEAVIEGIGASLMLPATLAILSTTFEGQERARAFAAWGAVAGVAVVAGPLVGGLLTTGFSWRWAFFMNVIISPLVVIGAFLFMRPDADHGRRTRIDVPGAVLIATGSFLLVFGISEATVHGAKIVIVFAFAIAVFTGFFIVERRKEAAGTDPLFEPGQLRHRGFRWGLLTTMVLAIGQFALIYVIPIWLQDGAGFSALRAGAWLVPNGLCIALGAPLAGRLTRRYAITSIVRVGLAFEAIGLVLAAFAVQPDPSFVAFLPASILFGLGIGFAGSQLTNVILSDVDPDKAGVAGGLNTTVRQIGFALGIATFTALLDALTVEDGARPALLVAAAVVTIGTGLSFLIPRVTVVHQAVIDPAPETLPADFA